MTFLKHNKHKSLLVLVSAVSIIASLLAVSVISQKTNIKSKAAEGTLKPLGTGTTWYWDDYPTSNHTSMEGFITIESDPTKTEPGIGYYWAHQFWGPGGGGYMGIQTNGGAGSFFGKIAIFSIWDAYEATPGQENGWCRVEKSGFDGGTANGATCRIPLPWKAGDSYRLRIATTNDDAQGRTWTAWVKDMATGQEQTIGNLKTQSHGLMQGALANWTEDYSGGRAACDAPYSKVIFGIPTVDNGAKAAASHSIDVLSPNPGGCTNSAIYDIAAGQRQEQSIPLPAPSAPEDGFTYLADLNWESATNGLGPIEKDQNNGGIDGYDGTVLRSSNTPYARGLGVYAPSEIRYKLNGGYSRFISDISVNDGSTGSVIFQVWTDGVKVFDSGVISGSATKTVDVNLAGKQELKLVTTDGGNGNTGDSANWNGARMVPIYLSELIPFHSSNGLGPFEIDKSNGGPVAGDGSGLTLKGVTYPKGLGVYAPSEIIYKLAGGYSRFISDVGISSGSTGSVIFQVWTDGTKVFDSGLMTGTSPTQKIDISLAGKNELKLVTRDADDGNTGDMGVWGGTGLTAAGSAPTPTSIPTLPSTPTPIPTSTSTPTKFPIPSASVPIVTITKPATGLYIPTSTTITATARDRVKISKMQVYIDGILKATSSNSSISYLWNTKGIARGSHTISVKAFNSANISGESSRVVNH